MFRKIVLDGPAAIAKFLEGTEVVDRMVGNTLGPGGRNRIIQQKYQSPMIINDGAMVARHIVLDDPIADMAAQTIIEVSMEVSEQAGDGTTTATIEACELVRTGYERLSKQKSSIFEASVSTTSPMQLKRDIMSEKEKALTILDEMKRPLGEGDLKRVVDTSLENLEFGDELVALLEKVGRDGYVAVEENWSTKKEMNVELTEGMKFLGKYASGFLSTDLAKKEALWEDTLVLVTNIRIDDYRPMEKLIGEIRAANKRRLVIINGYSEGVNGFGDSFIIGISKAVKAALQGNSQSMEVLAVKAPSLTSEELEDVAAFCNAKFIDGNFDLKLEEATFDDLGYAERISVTENEVNVMGGSGPIEERVELLKKQMENSKDVMFKEKIRKRIASLKSGQGIIRVGAPTDTERSYIKEKLKDAVSAAKAAMAEGVVIGGGLAQRDIAEKLGKDSILYPMLLAPSNRIAKNAGWEEVTRDENILDPVKVVRLGIIAACSGGALLITADGAIAEKKMDYMEWMAKALQKLVPRDERDDWRDDENQDLGAPTHVN